MGILEQIAKLSGSNPPAGMTSQDRLARINGLVMEAIGLGAEVVRVGEPLSEEERAAFYDGRDGFAADTKPLEEGLEKAKAAFAESDAVYWNASGEKVELDVALEEVFKQRTEDIKRIEAFTYQSNAGMTECGVLRTLTKLVETDAGRVILSYSSAVPDFAQFMRETDEAMEGV